MTLFLCTLLTLALALWWRERKRHDDWVTALTNALGLKHVESHLITETAEAARVAADQLPRERGLHEFFEAILNEIRQGVGIVDADMRISFANKPLASLLQRSAVHAGRTLIEELRDHQLIELVQKAIREQKRVTRQVQMLASSAAANLSGRHFMIEAAPLSDRRVGAAWLMVQCQVTAAQEGCGNTHNLGISLLRVLARNVEAPRFPLETRQSVAQHQAVWCEPAPSTPTELVGWHGMAWSRME